MATWLRQYVGESEDSNSKSARWVAVGFVSTQEALTDDDFPVAKNDVHPDYPDTFWKCSNVRIDASGFKVSSVTATYTIPTSPGGDHEPDEPSLLTPVVYAVQTVQEAVAIDRDTSGNPILNGSYLPINGVTIPRNYKRMVVTRWESAYSNPTALLWENSVNSDSFEGALPGEVKIVSIQPSGTFEATAELVPIEYIFDFKPKWLWGIGTSPETRDYPWQTVVKNISSQAYATIDSATKLVEICTSTGYPVQEAMLNASGVPVESSYTYRDPQTGLPVESPTWTGSIPLPDGAIPITIGLATFLVYLTSPSREFASLGL